MEQHERERRGPRRVLSGSPEKRIMGLGCGVGLSLSGFDHTIASSVKQHKNSVGQNRLSPLLSHYARDLLPHHPLFFPVPSSPFLAQSHPLLLFLLSLFISLSITHALFFLLLS